MRKQITRISPMQTAKVAGVVHFCISLPFLPIFLAPAFLTGTMGGVRSPLPLDILVVIPFLYAFFTFLLTLFATSLYNWAAGHFGGIEYTAVEVPSAPSAVQ
jgi:hypothetical protein